jgi:hypothetical protein
MDHDPEIATHEFDGILRSILRINRERAVGIRGDPSIFGGSRSKMDGSSRK